VGAMPQLAPVPLPPTNPMPVREPEPKTKRGKRRAHG